MRGSADNVGRKSAKHVITEITHLNGSLTINNSETRNGHWELHSICSSNIIASVLGTAKVSMSTLQENHVKCMHILYLHFMNYLHKVQISTTVYPNSEKH